MEVATASLTRSPSPSASATVTERQQQQAQRDRSSSLLSAPQPEGADAAPDDEQPLFDPQGFVRRSRSRTHSFVSSPPRPELSTAAGSDTKQDEQASSSGTTTTTTSSSSAHVNGAIAESPLSNNDGLAPRRSAGPSSRSSQQASPRPSLHRSQPPTPLMMVGTAPSSPVSVLSPADLIMADSPLATAAPASHPHSASASVSPSRSYGSPGLGPAPMSMSAARSRSPSPLPGGPSSSQQTQRTASLPAGVKNPLRRVRDASASSSSAAALPLSSGADEQPTNRTSRGISIGSSSAHGERRASDAAGAAAFSPAAEFLSSFSPPSDTSSAILMAAASDIYATQQQQQQQASGPGPDQDGFVIGPYVLGRELGHGGFGRVREARKVDDGEQEDVAMDDSATEERRERYAIKIISHADDDDDALFGPLAGTAAAQGATADGSVNGDADLSGSVSKLWRAGSLHRRGSGIKITRPMRTPSYTLAKGEEAAQQHQRERSTSSPMRSPGLTPSSLTQQAQAIVGADPVLPTGPSRKEQQLQREIDIWRQCLPHRHIVPLVDVERTLTHTYLVMPLCLGGNLLSFLRAEQRRKKMARSGSGSRRTSEPSTSRSSPGPALHSSLEFSFTALASSTSSEPTQPDEECGLELDECARVFAHVVDALARLHDESHVTHNDVKLENILSLDKDAFSGDWMLADFGLAATRTDTESQGRQRGRSQGRRRRRERSASASMSIDSDTGSGSDDDFVMVSPTDDARRMTSLSPPPGERTVPQSPPQSIAYPAGSLPYASPEQMRSREPIVHPAGDIWALGVVLYALLDGRMPFADDFEPRLRMRILKGEWERPRAFGAASSKPHTRRPRPAELAEEVLRGCLEPDPTLRWTISQVRDSNWLAHHRAELAARAQEMADAALGLHSPRGRTAARRDPSAGDGRSSSRSSTSRQRRPDRSTSRGSAHLHAHGVDAATRASELLEEYHHERRARWSPKQHDSPRFGGSGDSHRRAEPY